MYPLEDSLGFQVKTAANTMKICAQKRFAHLINTKKQTISEDFNMKYLFLIFLSLPLFSGVAIQPPAQGQLFLKQNFYGAPFNTHFFF